MTTIPSGAKSKSERGRFIVVEGIDGSGTTLQTRALAAWLRGRGHTVVETREPTDMRIGPLIRESLATASTPLDPRALALLFAADRLDHVARRVAPAVAEGSIVLSDRYLLSSLAYQTLDCDAEWVRTINRYARTPDLQLYLDVPVEVAFARVQSRRADAGVVEERFDVPALQRRVAAAYRALLDQPGDARPFGELVRIDGTPAPDVVTEALTDALRARGL